ncbi:hypothetical protein ACKKBG_A07180 [Auxenochlorella protothecoides x Auxenochlorella symbiontica]
MPETSPTTLAAVEEAGARDRHVLLGLAFCTACVLGHYPWCRAARPQPPPRESPTQSTPRKRSRPNSPPLADGPPRTFPCAAAAPQASDNLPLSRRADSVMCDPQDPPRRPLSGPSPAEAHGEGAQAGRSDCQNFQLDKLDVVAGLLTDTASLESAGQGPCDEPLRLPPDGLLSPARSILLTSRSPDPSPTHGVLPGLGPEGSLFEGAGSPGSLTRALAKVSQLLDQLPADSWSVQRAACSARGEAEVCSLGRLPISGMRQECGDGGAGNRGQPRSPPGAVEGETQAPPPGSPGIMRAASDPASPSHRVSAPGSTTDPTSPASPASFTASACILSQESSTPRPLSRRVSFEDGINPDRRASPPAPEPAAWTDPSTSPPRAPRPPSLAGSRSPRPVRGRPPIFPSVTQPGEGPAPCRRLWGGVPGPGGGASCATLSQEHQVEEAVSLALDLKLLRHWVSGEGWARLDRRGMPYPPTLDQALEAEAGAARAVDAALGGLHGQACGAVAARLEGAWAELVAVRTRCWARRSPCPLVRGILKSPQTLRADPAGVSEARKAAGQSASQRGAPGAQARGRDGPMDDCAEPALPSDALATTATQRDPGSTPARPSGVVSPAAAPPRLPGGGGSYGARLLLRANASLSPLFVKRERMGPGADHAPPLSGKRAVETRGGRLLLQAIGSRGAGGAQNDAGQDASSAPGARRTLLTEAGAPSRP